MVVVLPVAMTFVWIPVESEYATYFPSGEIEPLRKWFSLELAVICHCLRSRTAEGAARRWDASQTRATVESRAMHPATTVHFHRRRVGSKFCLSASRSAPSSEAL